MVRLAYMFWAVALFLAGCSTHEQYVRVYRPGVCQETSTPCPAGTIFDPPQLAASNAFGRSDAGGFDLNTRANIRSTNGWYDLYDTTWYQLYYYERQPSNYPNDGYLDRQMMLYHQGFQAR